MEISLLSYTISYRHHQNKGNRMKKLMLFLILGLLLSFIPIQAQTQGGLYQGVCIYILPVGDFTETVLDDNCIEYDACLDDSSRFCDVELFTNLLSICQIGDNTCVTDGLLLYGFIHWSFRNFRGVDGSSAITESLIDYNQSNYESALDWLEPLRENEYGFGYPYYYYSVGLMQSLLGNHEEALLNFDNALRWNFFLPHAYYSRALTHLILGNEERAGQDYYTFSQLIDEDIPSALVHNELVNLSVDILPTEEWSFYGLLLSSSGAGGSNMRDLALIPPRQIFVGFLYDGTTLALINVSEYVDAYRRRDNPPRPYPETIFLHQTENDPNTYRHGTSFWSPPTGGLSADGSHIEVMVNADGTISGFEHYGYSEAGATREFMLAPANIDDPRLELFGEACLMSPVPRLNIGDEGRWVDNPRLVREVFVDPAVDSELITEFFSFFIVLDGPECADGFTWWFVENNDGTTGWVQENVDEQRYNVRPVNRP